MYDKNVSSESVPILSMIYAMFFRKASVREDGGNWRANVGCVPAISPLEAS